MMASPPCADALETIPVERTRTLREARRTIEATLKGMGIAWRLETVGVVACTTKCVLLDDEGRELDYGYGKGDIEASAVGALFEAAEHWFSHFPNTSHDNVQLKRVECGALKCAQSARLPFSLIGDQGRGAITCREYHGIVGGDCQWLPVAIANPRFIDELCDDLKAHVADDFDYSNLSRYCSNSGVAIGSTKEEALIHGLLETIERDAFSDFLIDAFLLDDATAIRPIAPRSLSAALQSLVADMEVEIGMRILLCDMRSRCGLPVVCASLVDSPFSMEIVGFGCSLSREHATRRSLYELSQCFYVASHFHPAESAERSDDILARFGMFPFHERCAELKISRRIAEIGYTSVEFSEVPDWPTPTDLDAYLAEVTRMLV